VELRTVGRRTGRERRKVLTLFVLDDNWYIGHPNGNAGWVLNLLAADSAVVVRRGSHTTVVPVELRDGDERDRVVSATSRQPLPASLLYRASREHIRASGTYFRLERPARPEDS